MKTVFTMETSFDFAQGRLRHGGNQIVSCTEVHWLFLLVFKNSIFKSFLHVGACPERSRRVSPWRTSDSVQRPNFRQRIQFILSQFWNAPRQVMDRSKRLSPALLHNCFASFRMQSAHIAQAKPKSDFVN